MSERPSWMPSDRTLILAAIYVEDKSGSGTGEEEAAENLRDIVREAVEKALAEHDQERRGMSLDEIVYGNARAMHELVELRVACDRLAAREAK